MKCLLDTHIFIWALDDNKKLHAKHKSLIQDTTNEIYVSFYSLMEISIKMRLGKLPDFKASIDEVLLQLDKSDFTLINCDAAHLSAYETLPLFDDHRDPFDRFIIANALAEKLPILTYDKKFRLYKDLVQFVK